jgi:cation:H+ antiporter
LGLASVRTVYEWLINLLILLASLAVLSKSSELTITNSVRVADITGLGKTIVGFILVAFSTSLPELLVSIFSAIHPESIGVAIGNVLGSNIVDICLILGICFSFFASRRTQKIVPIVAKEEMGSLYFGLFIASMVPLALLYVGYGSQLIGAVLITAFVAYLLQISKTRNIREEECVSQERLNLRKYVFMTFIGAAGVVVSSYFIVNSASFIAENIGVPRVVIGATVVAFGTSIPELATSIEATRKNHLNVALGNIVGSCFINITLILGVTLVASPLNVNMTAFANLAMFSLMSNLLLWYFLSNEKTGRKEGAVLLFMYFLFLAISLGTYRA